MIYFWAKISVISGRDIIDQPVNLSCGHYYCQSCIIGIREERSSSPDSDSSFDINPTFEAVLDLGQDGEPIEPPKARETEPVVRSTIIYSATVLQPEVDFVCAICRKTSSGYEESRDFQIDLDTVEAACPVCSDVMTLGKLREHGLKCVPVRPEKTRMQQMIEQTGSTLSAAQADALDKARFGRNSSTFMCPFCGEAK